MSSLPVHNPRFDVPLRDPAWHQRLFWIVFTLLLLWPLTQATEFRPSVLFEPDNMRITANFIGSFFPPVLEPDLLARILRETWKTVAIATAGMVLALLIAFPLTIVSTRVLSVSAISGRMAALPFVVRTVCTLDTDCVAKHSRTGVGACVCSCGRSGPNGWGIGDCPDLRRHAGQGVRRNSGKWRNHRHRNLLRNGASRLQAFFYGLLPQNVMELTSYTVYRWECAIRSSVVLGFVGAGGLGQELDNSMKMFNGGEVATMLMVFILLVALADAVSAFFRKRLV